MGTGVRPNREVQSVYEVYVLKVPVEFLINSNTENYFGINEDEVLVADYIASSEVVATFARADIEGVYSYLHMVLGVTREDVRMGETDTRGESRDGGRERQEARYKMVP
jgi:hypothetical protein